MRLIKVVIASGIFVLGCVSASTQAAVSKLVGKECALADVSIVSNNVSVGASDCVGVLTGSNGGEINYKADDLNTAKPGAVHTSLGGVAWTPGAFAKDDWLDRAKYENGAGSALGLNLSFSNTAELTWSTTTALNGSWIVLVKQAKQVVLYLFDNLVQATGGKISLAKLKNGGYSHVTLLSRKGGGNTTHNVPLPATWLLLGLGVVFMGALRRRSPARQR